MIQDKETIRKKTLNLLRNQKEEDRVRNSLIILEKLFQLSEFQASQTVLFYAAFDGEVETFEMMKRAKQSGKRIALPIVDVHKKRILASWVENFETDLETGPYGIPQPSKKRTMPVKSEELNLVIVPGVAFDRRNHRLGRGAGYYDRFLKNLPPQTVSVGIAFDFQIVSRLPREWHDIPVAHVITN